MAPRKISWKSRVEEGNLVLWLASFGGSNYGLSSPFRRFSPDSWGWPRPSAWDRSASYREIQASDRILRIFSGIPRMSDDPRRTSDDLLRSWRDVPSASEYATSGER